MKRLFYVFLLAWIAALACGGATAAADSLRVMSYNIRYDNPNDGENTWSNRRDALATLIRDHDPDVIGMQEALASQVEFLTERLPDYDWYGVGRDDGKRLGEFAPIFYRRDRFTPVAKGTFWLCEQPEEAGRIGWGASCPRVASWIALKDKQREDDSPPVYFYNTHFDHRSALARDRSAKLIRARLAEIGDAPIVLTGDFNCRSNSPPIEHLTRGDEDNQRLNDAFAIASSPRGPSSTWNGFQRVSPNRRIDYVLLSRDWKVESYQVIDQQTENRFPSDHLPVLVEVKKK